MQTKVLLSGFLLPVSDPQKHHFTQNCHFLHKNVTKVSFFDTKVVDFVMSAVVTLYNNRGKTMQKPDRKDRSQKNEDGSQTHKIPSWEGEGWVITIKVQYSSDFCYLSSFFPLNPDQLQI